MRLLFAFADTRVLLALGLAFLIQLGLAGVWLMTLGPELERTEAELQALPPDQRLEAELDKVTRVVESFTADQMGDVDPRRIAVHVEPEAEDALEGDVLEDRIDSLEQRAVIHNEPAKPRGSMEIAARPTREEPSVLSTRGVLGVSCGVGMLILIAGAGMSLALLGPNDGGGEEPPAGA